MKSITPKNRHWLNILNISVICKNNYHCGFRHLLTLTSWSAKNHFLLIHFLKKKCFISQTFSRKTCLFYILFLMVYNAYISPSCLSAGIKVAAWKCLVKFWLVLLSFWNIVFHWPFYSTNFRLQNKNLKTAISFDQQNSAEHRSLVQLNWGNTWSWWYCWI